MPIGSIDPGPIIYDELPAGLVARVRLIRAALLDVYEQSLDDWIDGFRRDANPEREVAWWEHLTASYLEFMQSAGLPVDARAVAFRLVSKMMLGVPREQLGEELAALPAGSFELLHRLLSAE